MRTLDPRGALFVVQDMAQFYELFQVARTITASGRYAADFGFLISYPTAAADQRKLAEHGMTWFDESLAFRPPPDLLGRLKWLLGWHAARDKTPPATGPTTSGAAPPQVSEAGGPLEVEAVCPRNRGERAARWLAAGRALARRAVRLAILPARPLVRLAYAYTHYLHQLRQFRRILAQRRPAVIVLAEDNVSGATGLFTRAAHEVGCRVVVSPYTVANALEPAEAFYHLREHHLQRWSNRMFARLCPQWVFEYKGRRLLRLPAWNAAAQELLGIAPPRPWALNSGRADAIVVESQKRVEYYRAAGLKREPLIVTGGAFDDELAGFRAQRQSVRLELCRRHGLPADRPLVLCGLPPNQLSCRPQCQYGTFEALVRAWLEPIVRQSRFAPLVRLHPRLDRRELQFIEAELGLAISEEPTARLIAISDLYIASASATIRWAIACGVPVVNYDVFQYGYDDYDDAGGVLTVQTHQEYGTLVGRLCGEAGWYEDLRRRQEACREEWGRLDGRSGARIVSVFDRLVEGESLAAA